MAGSTATRSTPTPSSPLARSTSRTTRSSWTAKRPTKWKRPVTKLEYAHSRRDQIKFFLWLLKCDPCTDCGKTYPIECMQFDHCRGAKQQSVAGMTGSGWPTVLKELAKCDLVCANCHCVRTHRRRK